MPEVPKIVYSRLRAGVPGDHPDPDVLTAFAEQALPPAEREGVVQHLALCGDCREVIAIALPATEDAPVSPAPASAPAIAAPRIAVPGKENRRNWFAWPGLRWAGAVVALALVASVFTLRTAKRSQSTVASLKTPTSADSYSAPAVSAIPPTAAAPESLALDKNRESMPLQTRAAQATVGSRADSKSLSRGKIAHQPAEGKRTDSIPFEDKHTELAKLEPGLAGGVLKEKQEQTTFANQPAAAPAAPAADSGAIVGQSVSGAAGKPPATAATAAQQQMPQSSQTVTVQGESETVQVTSAASPVETSNTVSSVNDLAVTARNMESVTIEKAKPPTQAKAAKSARNKKQALGASTNYAGAYANGMLAESPAWQLSEGTLQHSLNSGSSWQTVLRADHPLFCHAARGNDVWAAGQAGTVFHSSDAGVTWTQLHPTVKDQALTTDVTAIALEKPGQAVLTSAGLSWITMDNGKTWSAVGATKQ